MSHSIISFGELLWDIMPEQTVLGGASANLAFRINNLGDTGLLVSRVGDDALGRQARGQLQALGVDIRFIQTDHTHPTGTVNVTFDKDQNPDYVIIPNTAYDFIETDSSIQEAVRAAQCICYGTLSQRSPKSSESLQQLLKLPGPIKAADINLRKDCYTTTTIISSMEAAHILKLNREEVFILKKLLGLSATGLPALVQELISKFSLDLCLVTLEDKGALAAGKKQDPVYSPGYQVNFKDQVGAGDSFFAGFIHCHLRGLPLARSCDFANKVGAYVAGQAGGSQLMDIADLETRFNSQSPRIVDTELQTSVLLG